MQAQALLSCAAVVAQASRRACAICGSEVSSTSATCGARCGNRLAQWSRSTRSGAERARSCEQCAASFVMRLPSGRARAGKAREGRFCSRPCAVAARTRPPMALATQTCRACAEQFTPSRRGLRLCSDRCRAADVKERSLAASLASDRRDRTLRPCRCCGLPFSPEYGNKRRLFCSEACGRRHARRQRVDCGKTHRKRARLAGVAYEPVNRLKVFERDRWRCQVCGIKTPKRLTGSQNPRAPELDHRVPLALGGPHSYANTQCACRACNSAKGGTRVRGQLTLFPAPLAA